MPVLDTGLFLFLNGLSFLFLFLSFRFTFGYDAFAKLFSTVILFSLALFMTAEYDVAQLKTWDDGTTTFTGYDYMIDENQQIVAMLYYVFGLASVILFFRLMVDHNEFKKSEMDEIKW